MTEAEPPRLAEEGRWYTEHTALLTGTLKWAVLGVVAGICVGVGTRVFLWSLKAATDAAKVLDRGPVKSWYLLPLALPACVWLIRTFAPTARGHGTEAVITAIHQRSGRVDWKVAPVKLLATVLTLIFGGSVGKEGPCAQIGAAITSLFADVLKLNDADRRKLVICGVGAGFASVFGLPISGALFGIEVLYLGRLEYSVLFPCVLSGIVAQFVSGVPAPVPAIASKGFHGGPGIGLLVMAFGVIAGLLALVLIETMRGLERLIRRFEQRPYAVAVVGGAGLAGILAVGGMQYARLGTATIAAALAGTLVIPVGACLVKILTTTVTLETGGSGGIVTPLFFIGTTAGVAFAAILHLPSPAFAAFGLVAMLAAAANTPVAAAVMGMEMLPPGQVGVYAALCACTAYLAVGHRSVYASQKLAVAKAAALDVPLDVEVGALKSSSLRVHTGTLSERLLRGLRRRPYGPPPE